MENEFEIIGQFKRFDPISDFVWIRYVEDDKGNTYSINKYEDGSTVMSNLTAISKCKFN